MLKKFHTPIILLIQPNNKTIPKLHGRGLRNLKGKCVFAVEALGIVESLILDLDKGIKETKNTC
jgi:hypothetical protein